VKLAESQDLEVKIIGGHNGAPCCWVRCGMLAYVDKKTGKLVRVEGNPNHPVSRGFVCKDRVTHSVEWLYHPAQLLYPLKRVGERGENKWQRISWEQALDEIADKLKEIRDKYGPEAIATCEGTYRSDLYWARARFLNLYGNPANTFGPGTICSTNCVAIQYGMLGTNTHTPDIANAALIVLASRNPPESLPLHWHVIMARKRAGKTKLITIDPRMTESARNSDVWLQIRPGTDVALFMAWIRYIIENELYDKQFVEKWTNAPFLVQVEPRKMLTESDVKPGGSKEKFVVWDTVTGGPAIWNPQKMEYEPKGTKPALKGTFKVKLADGREVECKTAWQMIIDRVEPCTPEWAEKITWVPKEKIIESARMYGSIRPACIYRGVALDQIGINATEAELCKTILRAITGNLDVIGGDHMTYPGPVVNGKQFIRDAHLQLEDKLPPEMKRKQLGILEYPVQGWPQYDITSKYYKERYGVPQCMSGHMFQPPIPLLWRAIITGKPYPIKGLITFGGNPLVYAANTKLVYKALKHPGLELHVVLEYWMTPTAQLADYVLPMQSKMFERPYCGTFEDFHSAVAVWDAAVKPLGERKNEYDFFKGLAERFGWGEYFPWKDYREVIDYRLSSIGMTFEEAVKKCIIYTPIEKQYEQINPKTGKPFGFATVSKRAQIYNYTFELLGLDPLPKYEEPVESPISKPTLAREYPLILTTGGRFRPQFHSEHRHWGYGMREQHPWPLVEIHPETARELGIADGDWVWIETPRGRIRQRARLTTAIHPRVVNCEASWWFPEMPGEEPYLHGVFISNANVLTLDEPETLDRECGNWTNRGLLCKVYKATGIDALG